MKFNYFSKNEKLHNYRQLNWSSLENVVIQLSQSILPRGQSHWDFFKSGMDNLSFPFHLSNVGASSDTVLKLHSLINGHLNPEYWFEHILKWKSQLHNHCHTALMKCHQCSNCWVMVFHRAALLSTIGWDTLLLKMTLHHWYKTLKEPVGIEDLVQQIVFFVVWQ